MKLFLRDEVFDRGGTDLLGFFQAVWEGRHAIALDEHGEQYGRWLGARSGEDQEFVNLAVQTSYGSLSKVVVDVACTNTSDWNNNVASVHDALALARLPYRILLENNNSDRRFLMAIADSNQRSVLEQAKESKNIDFVQGGGIEQIERLLNDDVQGDRARLKITFVLFDSDSEWIRRPSPSAKRVLHLCRTHDVPCHMLRRRSTENYLTLESLAEYQMQNHPLHAHRNQVYSAFTRLSRLQRRHYHMKQGFRKPHGPEFDSIKQTEPFLSDGWGNQIGEVFSRSSFRHHDLLHEGAMRELGPLMRKLIAHLR